MSSAPQIPDYELLRKIGSGSYGEVWLARGVTGIWRAIKVVWRARFADAAPFEREFKGLKEFAEISLGESSQMALLHVGRNDAAGFFYYVMELADDVERGRQIEPASYVPLTLSELRARRGRLSAGESVTFGVELARALAGLHRRGLVHRDIKPSNVILVNRVPKLADIGLVAPVSSARTFVGTEGYVPPEGPGSPGADVYALGKVLYELSTGLDRQEFPQLPPEVNRLPDASLLLELNEIILRACDPLPEQRYRDGAALLADLTSLHAGHSLSARRLRSLVWRAAVAVIVVGVGGWGVHRKFFARENPAPAPPPAVSPAASASAMISEKSLVVLPLENLSPDPADAFFTDGVHAEIIATLSRIADLKVISRPSALAFKGSTASFAEIARKLGVANVLTGSLRRAGDRVRIQLELRRASDEALLWASPKNDRELKDVFAIQGDIADEVARVLQARERTGTFAGAQFMTKDPRAYDLFLKAQELPDSKSDRKAALEQKIAWLEEALRLDSNFVSAAELLVAVHVGFYRNYPDDAAAGQHQAEAKRWAETASRLAPGGAGDGALSSYYTFVEVDNARALAFAQNELRALPHDTVAHNRVALALAALGRRGEAAAELQRALEFDPLSARLRQNLVLQLAMLRRTTEFETAVAEYETIVADKVDPLAVFATHLWIGGRLPPTPDGLPMFGRETWEWESRRFAEMLAILDEELAAPNLSDLERFNRLWQKSDALQRLGRGEEAGEAARRALALAEKIPTGTDPSQKDGWRMNALARANRAEEAIAAGRRYVAAMSPTNQVAERWYREGDLARVYALLGRRRECVELLGKLILVPSRITVPVLRNSPDWDNVRADPAFQALLADPKNSAPLP